MASGARVRYLPPERRIPANADDRTQRRSRLSGGASPARIAAWIGQALAFAFCAFGLLNGNPLLLFIAVFVYLAAASEAHAVIAAKAGVLADQGGCRSRRAAMTLGSAKT